MLKTPGPTYIHIRQDAELSGTACISTLNCLTCFLKWTLNPLPCICLDLMLPLSIMWIVWSYLCVYAAYFLTVSYIIIAPASVFMPELGSSIQQTLYQQHKRPSEHSAGRQPHPLLSLKYTNGLFPAQRGMLEMSVSTGRCLYRCILSS